MTHDHEEAFAVADSMALMREGRIVQRGTLAEVWGHPVDPDAALFLGYARTLRVDQAQQLARAAGVSLPATPLALRRSALTVAADGRLRGRVVGVRPTPDVLRLLVELVDDGAGLDGLGAVHAVDSPTTLRGIGEVVSARSRPRPDRPRGASGYDGSAPTRSGGRGSR